MNLLVVTVLEILFAGAAQCGGSSVGRAVVVVVVVIVVVVVVVAKVALLNYNSFRTEHYK